MGLDMYAYSVEAHPDNTDFSIATEDINRDFAYWRKLNALHGWMEDLAYDKGFSGDSFNCVKVRITLEDLNQLKEDLEFDKLKPRQGFFFGSQEFDEYDKECIREFIADAYGEIMGKNREIYYDSSW